MTPQQKERNIPVVSTTAGDIPVDNLGLLPVELLYCKLVYVFPVFPTLADTRQTHLHCNIGFALELVVPFFIVIVPHKWQ